MLTQQSMRDTSGGSWLMKFSQDASFWRWLEQEVNSPTSHRQQTHPINFQTCYAEDLARAVNSNDWHRLSASGNEGERYYDWACVALSCRHPEGFSRWFLFRPERPNDPSFISYYQVFAPSDTS